MRNAQVALEFIIYIMLGVLLVAILIGLAGRLTADELQDQGAREAQDLARTLQQELLVAAQMSPGYHRVIEIPQMLRQGDYGLSNTQESLTITKAGMTITLKTPITNGTLTKGHNVISNEQGTITIKH